MNVRSWAWLRRGIMTVHGEEQPFVKAMAQVDRVTDAIEAGLDPPFLSGAASDIPFEESVVGSLPLASAVFTFGDGWFSSAAGFMSA